MKFLCFHGAIGNIGNFSIQLAPLEQDLEKDDAATFQYLNAPIFVEPPAGFQDYFGIGPHYRWFEDAGAAENGMLERIRTLPPGSNPEEVLRGLRTGGGGTKYYDNEEQMKKSTRQTLDMLHEMIADDDEIQGLIGYSEGSSVAGTLILDEERLFKDTGRPRRIKCAMFFTGWPPLGPYDLKPILFDESDVKIDVPTLHVIGANDPYKDGALALYNVCDEDTARLFDTGKGHTIPRSGLVITEMANAVREMIAEALGESKEDED